MPITTTADASQRGSKRDHTRTSGANARLPSTVRVSGASTPRP